MMLNLNRLSLRSCVLSGLLALGLNAAVLPLQPAWAQARALPDFTDLVDQVGPSVVNIRTLEKAKPSSTPGNNNNNDEQMLEFFRRFGIPVPPNLPRSPRPGLRTGRTTAREPARCLEPRVVGVAYSALAHHDTKQPGHCGTGTAATVTPDGPPHRGPAPQPG